MKIRDYIKDRGVAYVIGIVAYAIVILFLIAYKTNKQAIFVVTVILFMAVILAEIWNYVRKRDFYRHLDSALSELDKKYLIPEMLKEADFFEGKVLYETLSECCKSMAEHVSGAEKKAKEFREYIEMWVHEAKLPVASLTLMCHNSDEPDEKMLTQLKRLDDNIENVLYYARSETSEKDYLIKEVSLKKTFSAVAVKNMETLQTMDFEVRTEGLDITVLTDGKWLEYILGQLMANSIKYAAKGRERKLLVTAKESEKAVTLHFYDNGVGISKSDLPYVFEKSFTGENGRSGAKSTGMGLYIVKNLCDRLGHGISINSEKDSFTEVTITFPKNDFYFAG